MSPFDPEKRIYGILYAATTALFFALLAIFMKVALYSVAPMIVVWFRFMIAFLILFGYFSFRNPGKLSIFRKPPWLLIIASAGLTINYLGFAKGVQLTSPGNAQIFIQIGPMALAAAGIIFFKERLSFRQFAGFLVVGGGFTLFYRDQLRNLLGSEELYLQGIIWVVISALAWTVFAALQKSLIPRFHAQQLNMAIFSLPTVLLIPLVDFSAFSGFRISEWFLLLSLGIITIVAYGCLAESFKYMEANKISVINTLSPLITFLLMDLIDEMKVNWIESEVTSIYGYLGAFIVISGAVMVVIPKKKYLTKN